MRGIPHHLLDVLDPTQEVTAAWYKERATGIIDEILAAGDIPMLVGGSMLYLSSVIDDLRFPQKGSEAVRKKLEEEYNKDGGKALYQKLRAIDPDTAASFSRGNMPYVVRALQIYEEAGEKPSKVRGRGSSPYDLLIFGMHREREEMKTRIEKRTRELFEKGWMEEVRDLIKQGYTEDDPGMKSHGYRQIMQFLKTGSGDFATLQSSIVRRAQQYAKRQMTWWKRDGRIRWVSPTPVRLPHSIMSSCV